MNDSKRALLREARSSLENAGRIINDVMDDEQTSLENIPENMQSSSRYEDMESAIESMSEAIDSIEEAVDSVDSVIE